MSRGRRHAATNKKTEMTPHKIACSNAASQCKDEYSSLLFAKSMLLIDIKSNAERMINQTHARDLPLFQIRGLFQPRSFTSHLPHAFTSLSLSFICLLSRLRQDLCILSQLSPIFHSLLRGQILQNTTARHSLLWFGKVVVDSRVPVSCDSQLFALDTSSQSILPIKFVRSILVLVLTLSLSLKSLLGQERPLCNWPSHTSKPSNPFATLCCTI